MFETLYFTQFNEEIALRDAHNGTSFKREVGLPQLTQFLYFDRGHLDTQDTTFVKKSRLNMTENVPQDNKREQREEAGMTDCHGRTCGGMSHQKEFAEVDQDGRGIRMHPGNASGSSRRSYKVLLGRRMSEPPDQEEQKMS